MSSVAPSRSLPIRVRFDDIPVWTLIAAGALLVRLVCLDHSSFWLDEILEVFTIRERWSGLGRSLRWQALQAPLDYVLRKLFESIDPADWVRRLPGIVWGKGSIVAFGSSCDAAREKWQLCLGYYIVGPDWLCCKRDGQREIVNLDGDLLRLMAAWD